MTSDQFWDVHFYECVDSTNRRVKEALAEGAAEGLCVTALQQKGGYGRQGRTWASPLGGSYTSFALRPKAPLEQVPLLSLVASLAVYRTLERCRGKRGLAIKWPNDVLCNGGKIAGISLEATAGGVCLGIGLNVFPSPDAQVVPGKYSLSYIYDGVVSDWLSAEQAALMADLHSVLLEEVRSCYTQWCAEGFAPFLEDYRSSMAFLERYAALETIDGKPFVEGTIKGIDEEGRLLVLSNDGAMHAVASGEVHVASVT